MVILGLSPIVHESAVGLVVDGKLVAAAAEERFSRIKSDGAFPDRALQFVFDKTGLSRPHGSRRTGAAADRLRRVARSVPLSVPADPQATAQAGAG